MRAFTLSLAFTALLASTAFALTATATLGDWRRASAGERLALAKVMLARVRSGLSSAELERQASRVQRCVDGVAGDGGLDSMQIGETAASCMVLDGELGFR